MFAGAALAVRDVLHEVLGVRGIAAAIGIGTVLCWFAATPRIALASTLAFLLAETTDTAIYTRLRHRTRICAAAASNLVGALIDTLVFVPLAFGSWALLPGQLLGKTAATVLVLPMLGRSGRR